MFIETNDSDILNIIENNKDLIMVFGAGLNCGVCSAVKERVKRDLMIKYPKLKIYYLTVDDSPLFRGNYLVFTFPTLILFDQNKEIRRESRIVDFYQLNKILELYYN